MLIPNDSPQAISVRSLRFTPRGFLEVVDFTRNARFNRPKPGHYKWGSSSKWLHFYTEWIGEAVKVCKVDFVRGRDHLGALVENQSDRSARIDDPGFECTFEKLRAGTNVHCHRSFQGQFQ